MKNVEKVFKLMGFTGRRKVALCSQPPDKPKLVQYVRMLGLISLTHLALMVSGKESEAIKLGIIQTVMVHVIFEG